MNSWIVIKVTTSPCGKGDLKAEERVIGYSEHKQAKELFSLLEKAYPNIPIRRHIEETLIYVDKEGTQNLPYRDFIYFEEGRLIEF